MSQTEGPIPVTDPRVRLAAERTLLAWVRTGLALMGFGFVVARFGLFLRELAAVGKAVPTLGWSQGIGLILILLGVATNFLAGWEHLRFLRRLERGDADPFPRWSLAVSATVVLGVLGIGMALYLIAASH